MNPKVIALDMDGTLLNAENKVTNELLSLLQDVQQKKDIRLFLASGRTRFEIDDVLPSGLEPDGIVTANGMGCYMNGNVLFEHKLNPDLVRSAVHKAREAGLYYEIHPHIGSQFALKKDKGLLERVIESPQPETLLDNEYLSRKQALNQDIQWVENLSYDGNVKLYFFSMNPGIIKEWKQSLLTLEESFTFTTSSSTLHNCEIMEGHVSKASGIHRLLEEYNFTPEDLMAIGDGENDLPMLELAGYSVAMQNAEEVVKRSADDITEFTYKENGLYSYLAQKLI
ncbi:haloacid dehalogenase [Halobacillus andaensis]|uniref:Haloacid dehalogenase n=1 Tax=Halobacillus andaensis TaxID=1176239 RepID=A0A917B9C1_HALAA|nr:HAD family hydrolase [Halobacillus andaensis]MBP2005174.1 Cof subfamily protein (haloacid dehalogenase superfamily) [Halobacillus andaensis]GGF29450.1 haloacid dehalogenase [Halobacillus andaensis]